jgi:LPXTG-motif cell wall-anchored protein
MQDSVGTIVIKPIGTAPQTGAFPWVLVIVAGIGVVGGLLLLKK